MGTHGADKQSKHYSKQQQQNRLRNAIQKQGHIEYICLTLAHYIDLCIYN